MNRKRLRLFPVDIRHTQLEAPFENLSHDISLTAITRTIEINLKEMLGEREIPEPLPAVDEILW